MTRTIMVVDDEPDLIFSVKCGLEDFADGYIVLGAGSGLECFELLKKGQIPEGSGAGSRSSGRGQPDSHKGDALDRFFSS